jgi:hypothetical protein
MEDKSAPLDWARTNKALADILVGEGPCSSAWRAHWSRSKASATRLLVTDLEALHPFLRIGAIESQLMGKFHVPTDLLLPRHSNRQDEPQVSGLLPSGWQLPVRPRWRLNPHKSPGKNDDHSYALRPEQGHLPHH